MSNHNPEQIARDAIDAQLRASGWDVQDKSAINFHLGPGQAIREYTNGSKKRGSFMPTCSNRHPSITSKNLA